MVINKKGEEFNYESNKFYIGQIVYANNESAYEGLIGTIKEIRDGKDKNTDNETPDIYVRFEEPCGHFVKKYEDRFSELYGEKKTIDEICLDEVIMAPSMLVTAEDLECISEKTRQVTDEKTYVVVEEWFVNDESGLETYGSFSLEDAKGCLARLKEKERTEGCVYDWQESGESVTEDDSEGCYAAYIEGYYCSAHYSLTVKEIKRQ